MRWLAVSTTCPYPPLTPLRSQTKDTPDVTQSLSVLLKTSSAQMLPALGNILRKGAEYAAARNVPEEVLLNSRLFPDMFALTRQVQIACDQVTRGGARLAGQDLPSFPDIETSFAELIERTARANEFCQGLSAEAIDARADTSITIPIGGGNELTLPCGRFCATFLLPNLYFHSATAYNILRHSGVALGKKDFLQP